MPLEQFILAAAGTFAIARALDECKRKPLPPSPGGTYPLIGHALVIPTEEEHLTYAKWSKELESDIISLQALGKTIVVLSSLESAIDLLEHRSAIYSDRPQLPVISDPDLLDWSHNTGSLPYGDRWRKQRRMTHDVLKSTANNQHFALMEVETRAMLKRMLESPHASFEKEVRR
ncbi:hypothetical protein FRC12_014134 [Ceratobasidium sp. 428]|nr:hypothetical protein FRC12_014134 [Ceratobasidium sp. 428]